MVDLAEHLELLPPDRRSLADEVGDRLRHSILAGRFQPGEPLREEGLASVLGVSRGPIRQALGQLEREGLVDREPNKTARVARLTRADVDEIYSLRLVLEQLAVRRLLARGDAGTLADLRAILGEMAAAAQQGIAEFEYAGLDCRFHDALYRGSDHSRLYEAWSDLRPQVQLCIFARARARDDYRAMLERSHAQIVEAVEAGDPDEAAAVVAAHIDSSYVRVIAAFDADARAIVPAPARSDR